MLSWRLWVCLVGWDVSSAASRGLRGLAFVARSDHLGEVEVEIVVDTRSGSQASRGD